MKRAIRRHHKIRMKVKASKIYPGYKDSHGYLITKPQIHLADNLASCSCPACGNRRKYEGPTLQEKQELFES